MVARESFLGQGRGHGVFYSTGRWEAKAVVGYYLCDERPGGACDLGCWATRARRRAVAITKALNQVVNHEGCDCKKRVQLSYRETRPLFVVEIPPESRATIVRRANRLGAAGVTLPLVCDDGDPHTLVVATDAQVIMGRGNGPGRPYGVCPHFTHIWGSLPMGEIGTNGQPRRRRLTASRCTGGHSDQVGAPTSPIGRQCGRFQRGLVGPHTTPLPCPWRNLEPHPNR